MEEFMASRGDDRLKQRAVIEFLTAEACAPNNIHRSMTAVYGVPVLTSALCGGGQGL